MEEEICENCKHYAKYKERDRSFELCSYEANDGIIIDKEIPVQRTCDLWETKSDEQ